MNVEFHWKMTTDFQSFFQVDAKALSKVHRGIAIGNDCIDKVVTVDEDAVKHTCLLSIGFHLVGNDPLKIDVIDRTVKEKKRIHLALCCVKSRLIESILDVLQTLCRNRH